MMTPNIRKLNLVAHVTVSVGWFGAVASFLVLSIVGLNSHDALNIRAAYLAMGWTTWFVIVPLSLASPLTGIIQSMNTPLGLFRHYWILVKLLITIPATILLLLHLQPIGHLARVVAQTTLASGELGGMRIKLAANAGAALLVLLIATALSAFKPWGLTPYGQRKHEAQFQILNQSDTATAGDGRSLGLKILLAIVGLIVAVIVVLHVTGRGFGMHGH